MNAGVILSICTFAANLFTGMLTLLAPDAMVLDALPIISILVTELFFRYDTLDVSVLSFDTDDRSSELFTTA